MLDALVTTINANGKKRFFNKKILKPYTKLSLSNNLSSKLSHFFIMVFITNRWNSINFYMSEIYLENI